MAQNIRNKIAHRIFELCSSNNSLCVDELTRVIKYKQVSRGTDPILLRLPVKFNGLDKSKTYSVTPKDELLNSFKGDDCVSSVQHQENTLVFSLDRLNFAKNILQNILQNKEFWKNSFPNIKPQKIIVEFSSPNIAKPFHAGHLRSTVIGNFVSNLNAALGHEVITLNFLGDWGTQFGLLNVGYDLMGSQEELEKNPIGHLFNIYVAMNQKAKDDPTIFEKAKENFRALENENEIATKNWKLFRNLTVRHLEETYKRLGITFSAFHWESTYSEKIISSVLQELKNAGHLQPFEGAQVLDLNLSKKKRIVTMVKSDGASVYLSRDLAAAIDRFEKYQFDQMYYVVDNAQHDHFDALFHVLKLMGKPWHKNIHHVKFGRILGMSTRRGNVVFLENILDEAKTRMLKAMEESENTKVRSNWDEVADVLGTSAVFVNDLKYGRCKDYEFDWSKVLCMTGASGINLQYTHARLCSLQENCGYVLGEYDVELLEEPEAIKLISCLSRFDQVLYDSYVQLEPCYVVKYLFDLSHFINSAIRKLRVKGEESSTAQARLALFTASQLVMKKGMQIVGLNPLNKM